jgi:hypothetical protein
VRTSVQTLAALAGILAFASSVAQDQVRFTGNTTADETLMHDAFQGIALYIRESLKCSGIELVEAEVLPPDSVKRDESQPEGTNPATYERWTVTYCGKTQPFLVVFWTAKEGGTMYRIQLRSGTDS